MAKPTRVEVPLYETLAKIFPQTTTLIHSMQEGDVLCEDCKGTGLVLDTDNIYGLAEESDQPGPRFPYSHQTMVGCDKCCGGIRRMCPYCKQLLNRFELAHLRDADACPGQREAKQCEKAEREEARRAGLERVKLADYKLTTLYCDNCDEFVNVDELDPASNDHFEHTMFACTESKSWVRPEASDVLDRIYERASEEIEEGSDMVHVSDVGEASLQVVLDSWFADHVELQQAYWPNRDVIVEISDEPEDEEGEPATAAAEAK